VQFRDSTLNILKNEDRADLERDSVVLMGSDSELLRMIAVAPFAEYGDLAALLGVDTPNVKAGLCRLLEHRLVYYARHEVSCGKFVRRWFLTNWGTFYLAWMEGEEFEDIVRRYPISESWRDRFLRNLDLVSNIYGIVRQLAGVTSGDIDWRWVVSERLGGFVSVGRRSFGVLHLGRSVENEDAASIMCNIGRLQKTQGYPNMLVLRPGPLAVDKLVSDCRDAFGGWIYVAAADGLTRDGERTLWRRFGCLPMDLGEVVRNARPVSFNEDSEYGPRGAALNEASLGRMIAHVVFTGDHLGVAQRRILELLFEWPLASASFVGTLLDIQSNALDEMLKDLVGRNLVAKVSVKGLSHERLCLSDEGLRWFAERDGERSDDLLRRRSKGRLGVGGSGQNDSHAGYEMREVWRWRQRWDRNMSVLEWFYRDLGERETVRFREAVPGAQWARMVEVGRTQMVFTPEVILRVVQDETYRDVFLDMVQESQVSRAVQMRIGSFLAYARSVEATIDFIERKPLLLVVVKEERISRALRTIMSRRFRFPVPVFVAALVDMHANTPFGRVWKNASEQGDSALTFNEMVNKEVMTPGYRDYGSSQVFDDVDGRGREFRRGAGLQSWLKDAGESRIRQR